MEFLYFAALLFGYLMGILTILIYQWLERRSLTHTQEQAELDSAHEEGYTLTLVERPGDLSEGE